MKKAKREQENEEQDQNIVMHMPPSTTHDGPDDQQHMLENSSSLSYARSMGSSPYHRVLLFIVFYILLRRYIHYQLVENALFKSTWIWSPRLSVPWTMPCHWWMLC